MKQRPKNTRGSGIAKIVHDAERKVQHQAQVFFDTSGRRKVVVNILAILMLAGFISMVTFSTFYVFQIIRARDTVLSTDAALQKNTGIALFFTDNSSKATAITNDQLVDLSLLVVPRFQLTPANYETPATYREWDDGIKGVGRYKPVHYQRYFVLSSRDYDKLPTERMELSGEQANMNRLAPSNIGVVQMERIARETKQAAGNGLFIELDLSAINSEAEANTQADWLKAFSDNLKKQGLALGVMYRAGEVNAYTKPVLAVATRHYVTFDLAGSMADQVQNLRQHDDQLSTAITYELPTVSTKHSFDEFNDYIESKPYTDFQQQLLGRVVRDRSVEPIELEDTNTVSEIRDAVTANNAIRLLTASILLRKDTSFAIANPGYEEYTAWGVIKRPADHAYARDQLANKMYSALSVDQQGAGYVYAVEHGFSPGTRDIVMAADGNVVTSKVIAPEKNALVKRSGHQPKKVALTFDDGPGRVGTREVMDILDSHDVKGTFFLIGQNVVANPDIAQEIVRRGHEVENHSYNHPKFDRITDTSKFTQISATSAVIKEITGIRAKYFRQPNSVDTGTSTRANIEYLNQLKSMGLSASEYGIDSKDWEVATAAEATERVISAIDQEGTDYSQILFHDNHENIQVTLESLPVIIKELRQRGIELVRVDQLANTKPVFDANLQPETNAFRAMKVKDILITVFVWLNICLIGIALMKYAWILLGTAAYTVKRIYRRVFVFMVKKGRIRRDMPSFTAIIACYNEELVIRRTLQSLVDCNYPNLRTIVVNDGSRDQTERVVRRFMRRHRRVKIFSIPNGGKARALSYGIERAKTDWLVFCDADTIFHKNALHNFAYSTMTDKYLGAVAGQVIVGNDINLLTRAQALEYGVAHFFIKAAQDIFNTVTVVPGAISLWNRRSLLSIGGFTSDTLAEDADATMRVIIRRRTVRYWSNVKARTEAPTTWKMHFKQRTRWQLGNMQAVYKHRRAFFNSKHHGFGVIGVPFFYADLVAALIYPLLFVFALFIMSVRFYNIAEFIPSGATFIISPLFTYYSLSMFAIEIFFALVAIVSQRRSLLSKLALFLTIPYYMTVYRFLLSYATLTAALRALRGTLHGWGHQKRTASVK